MKRAGDNRHPLDEITSLAGPVKPNGAARTESANPLSLWARQSGFGRV
jgi:hypothetical protein